IYNGVDHSLFSDGGRENRDYNKIVFVGALVMDKGVHLLLNAFHQIRANHPKLSLDIYGSSSMWDREELFDTEQIEREMPGVKFHGAVPQEEIAAAFKGAGLCVIPSIWFDSFPLTAVEAQACGCPVVCFRVGGIPEAIDNGSTGIVIEEISPEALAETLNNLLSDTDRLRKLSKNAAVWAKERFSWINVAKSVSRICEGENTNAGEKTPYFQGTIATGRFGFLSTWNQNCGLATYGRYFLENFPKGSYIVFGEKSNRDAPDEEFVVRCWKRRSRDFSELDSAITKSGIKLLYLNCHYNFFPQPEFSRFLRKIRDRGIKVIAHIHNPYTVDSALQALITSVDHVVVHTPENALEIVANGGAPDRVTVIPHGVKIHDRLDPQQCKEALGVPADENLIVSFGFIQPHKGIEGLIEGIAHLNSKGICAHGIVVGGIHKEDPNSEAYFNSLLNLCDSLGVKDRVRFTGDFVPDSDVPTYLYGADVVLMNYGSQHYEASGACSLAIGAGSVVAASIAPPFLPFRDAVWHITSGYPLTLSLELLLTNRTLRDRIKKAAQAYKQKNAWPEITRKVNNLFKKVGFKAEAAKRGGTGEIKVRVLREERRVMRVLMQNRPTAYEQPGGDTVVMDRLKEGLEKRGVYVDIDLTGEADISKYNLVHLFNFATPDYTRMLARRAYEKGVPYVVTALCEDVASFHNQSHVCAEFMKEYVRRGQDREWYVSSKPDYKAIESSGSFDAGWIAENASAVFVTGAKEGQVIKRLYPNTAPIKVVKLGYEVRMEGDPNLFINRYGVRDFVLCVGRLESRKNQLMLLKALEDVSLPLVLIGGDFSYQPDYAQAVRLFKRSGETLVLGRLPEEMLASAYAAAKVHALPSWYELPGLVSLEAGFYGCNIVACNRGTIYDYLGDRVFYCNPEDEDSIRRAVLMAFQRPNQSGLKEVIMENTWDKAAEKTLETYQRIAGKPLEDSSDRSETIIDLGRGVYDMD
ncbi:MAG: glycosyltransferase, partial [Candidatus Dadabacteria bacterium]